MLSKPNYKFDKEHPQLHQSLLYFSVSLFNLFSSFCKKMSHLGQQHAHPEALEQSYPPPPPPPAGYPVKNAAQVPQNGRVKTKSRGDGFWKGCAAALCCCCVLETCCE